MATTSSTTEVAIAPNSELDNSTIVSELPNKIDIGAKAEYTPVISGNDREARVEIQQETNTIFQNQFHDFVQTFRGIESELKATDRSEKMILDLLKTYSDFAKLHPNKDGLELVEEFLKTDKGMVLSVKVADWQLATYQRATGAKIEQLHTPEEVYHARVVIDQDSSKQRPLGSVDVTIRPPSTREKYSFRKKTRDDAKKQQIAHDEQVRAYAKYQSSPEYQYADRNATALPLELRARAVSEARNADLSLQERYHDIAYEVTFKDDTNKLTTKTQQLSSAQQKYLREKSLLTDALSGSSPYKGVTFRDAQAEHSKQQIANTLIDITQARIDFYTAVGMSRADIGLSTLNESRKYDRSLQTNVLHQEHEQPGVSGHNALNYIEGAIQTTMEELRELHAPGLREAVLRREGALSQNETDTVDGIIEKLKAPLLGEEEVKQQKEAKQKEIDEAQVKIDITKKLQEYDDEIKAAERELEDEKLKLESYSDTKLKAVRTTEVEISQKQASLVGLEAKRSRTQSALDDLRENSVEVVTNTKTKTPELLYHVGAEDRIKELIAELKTIGEQIDTISDEINIKHQELQSAYLAIDSRMTQDEVNNRVSAIIVKQQAVNGKKLEKTRYENRPEHAFLSGSPPPPPSHLVPDHWKGEKERYEAELARIGESDWFRSYKRETYEAYAQEVQNPDKFEGISERIQKYATEDPDFMASIEYKNRHYNGCPPVYIRTLQVLFGPDVVKENTELFAKASKIVTPELFFDVFNRHARKKLGSGILAKEFHDVDHIKDLSSELFSEVLKTIRKKAVENELGEMPQAEKDTIKLFESLDVTGVSLDLSIKEVANLLASSESTIYHYRSVADLARQVKSLITTSVSDEQVKLIAQKIDKDRRERYKS